MSTVMMSIRGASTTGLSVLALLALMGCMTGRPDLAPSPWAAPDTEYSGQRGVRGGGADAPTPIEALTLNTTASGALTNIPVADGLPDAGRGVFGSFGPFGSLMRAEVDDVKPRVSIEDLATEKVTAYDDAVYAGVSNQDDGSGFFGEFAVLADSTLVWMARHETGELALDNYEVYSMVPGGSPTLVGSSTPDVSGGLALSAPGDGNYLTVVGGSAFWVEGDLTDATADAKQYSNVYTAPIDGSRSQSIAVDAARLPRADTCTAEPTLVYAKDATSSAGQVEFASITAVSVDSDGRLGQASLIWEAPDPAWSLVNADVCGDRFAVAYTDWSNGEDAETHPSGVLIGGPNGIDYFAMPEDSTGAGGVTVTPFGVFFFDWGGLSYGKQYFYSFESRELYFIGNGASFGFTKVGDECAAMAWSDPDVLESPSADYRLRKVCAS